VVSFRFRDGAIRFLKQPSVTVIRFGNASFFKIRLKNNSLRSLGINEPNIFPSQTEARSPLPLRGRCP
jgi:hypothetical protein